MTQRLDRASTGADKRCRFCLGAIQPDLRKTTAKKSFEKVFCDKVCRGRWHTLNSLQKKKDSCEAKS